MKKYLFAIIAAILLIASCSSDPRQGDVYSDDTVIDASSAIINTLYTITTEREITLNGLKEGGIYTIYPEERSTSGTSSIPLENSITTDNGTIIITPDSDGTITFTGADIGIEDGTFRITEQKPSSGRMIIDTSKDDYLFINSEGQKVYEKYFLIQVCELENPRETVLFTSSTGSSSGSSSDYGFVVNGEKVGTYNPVDLSGEEEVLVFMQRSYGKLNTASCTFEIHVDSPILLEKDASPVTLTSPDVYKVARSSDELVLEMEISESVLRNFSPMTRYPWPRTVSEGRREGNMFPLSYSDGKLLYYVGTVSEDIIFDVATENGTENCGTIALRRISSEEKSLIKEFNVSDKSITIEVPETDGFWICPIHFTNTGSGEITLHNEGTGTNIGLFVNASMKDGYGYSSLMAPKGGSLTVGNRFKLEYGYLYSKDGTKEGTVTINAD